MFEHEAGLRPAGTAVGIGRYGVGEQHLHRDIDGRDAIRPGQDGGIDRSRDGRSDGGGPGAEGGLGAHAQTDEVSGRIQRQLGLGPVVARLIVRDKGFAAAADPLQRALQPACRPGQHRFLGIVLALGAEAAADIGRDHPQRVLGHAQLFAHQQSHMVRRLGAGPEREGGAIGGQAAAAFVGGLCQYRTRFDGSTAQALIAQADACDMCGPGKGRIGGSRIAALCLHAQIVGQIGMHAWRIRARCIACIDHRR